MNNQKSSVINSIYSGPHHFHIDIKFEEHHLLIYLVQLELCQLN
jgi:hypothetical protein